MGYRYITMIMLLFAVVGCASPSKLEWSGRYATDWNAAWHSARLRAEEVGGQMVPLGTKTQSMDPFLPKYCILVFVDDWENVEVGDVVLRRMPSGKLYCHMVGFENNRHFVTLGTNNPRHDPGWMTEKDYNGTVVDYIRYNE